MGRMKEIYMENLERFNGQIPENLLHILQFEENLVRYEKDLEANPESLFHQGLVKNTKEYINELLNQG